MPTASTCAAPTTAFRSHSAITSTLAAILATAISMWLTNSAWAEHPIQVTDFADGGIGHFKERSFVGHTRYELINQTIEPAASPQVVLKASAHTAASALYREVVIDISKTPYLRWHWKVENVLDITNPFEKAGDDYPARVYVVIKHGPFPWQVRSLNYVWANTAQTKPHWPNPFTERAIMIPLRAGRDGLGQWHSESVNVAEDYERVFGEKISQIHGIAIMSDTDNAGGKAVAFYGDISFSEAPTQPE